MTLPQDDRAPHRQQRWLELENVGESTIPPFGAVEIVESYRPEDSGLTPGGGPTVIQVKRPTVDSSDHFLINGPVEIPREGRGLIGTNDYPTMAAYSGNTPVSGQDWGTVANSYFIGKNRTGLKIVGDADSALSIVRVNRDYGGGADLAEAYLDQNLCGTSTSVTVRDATYIPHCGAFTPSKVTNPRGHRGPINSLVLMVRKHCPDGTEEWQIFDVELRPYCAVVGLDDRDSCLVAAGLQLGGEWCPTDEPITACVIVDYIDCYTILPECDRDWVFAPLFACCGQGAAASTTGSGGGGSPNTVESTGMRPGIGIPDMPGLSTN